MVDINVIKNTQNIHAVMIIIITVNKIMIIVIIVIMWL